MARYDEDLHDTANRGTEPQNDSDDYARPGTEAHSLQGHGHAAQHGAYDRHQGQRMGGSDRQEPAPYGQPAEYDDRYAQQGGKPPQAQPGQPGILGEKDLQPMPNAGTSGGSGEHARKPDSERNR